MLTPIEQNFWSTALAGHRTAILFYLNLEKYGISGKRYKELCGFCEQYPEWINELKFKNDTVRSVEITDMPICHNNSDATGNLAVKRNIKLNMDIELLLSPVF